MERFAVNQLARPIPANSGAEKVIEVHVSRLNVSVAERPSEGSRGFQPTD